jgi:hypothetical protein
MPQFVIVADDLTGAAATLERAKRSYRSANSR